MALRPLRLRSCSLIGNVEDPAVRHHAIVCCLSTPAFKKPYGSSCPLLICLFVLVSTFLPLLALLFAVWELDIIEDRALTGFQ
jgi:hypothetical protein